MQGVLRTSGSALLLFGLFVYLYVFTRRSSDLQQDFLPLGVSVLNNGTVHPVAYLVELANAHFLLLQDRQSTTLEMAVDEYQRRYSIPPPPHFDRWYEFATQRGTKLIDEFDDISDSLSLFWCMEPHFIRQRAREILGRDNALMGATIRQGKVRIVGAGQGDFQALATQEMLSKFSEWLPDVDLAFNVNDEPRVLVPHEDVQRLLAAANLSKNSIRPARHNFSELHDLGDGYTFEPVSESPFNQFDHRQTFTHTRMSCPPESPSRSFHLDTAEEELGLQFEGLTFVDNVTAFSDVCLSSSMRTHVGLFNKPNVLFYFARSLARLHTV